MEITSHVNSFLKSLVWRILGVLVLGTITYIFTHSWFITTAITLIHHATFLLVFYLHERLWKRIPMQGAKRNIIKALVYEIILGMGIGGLIVLIITGRWSAVTQITLTYTAVKLVMYYFYDRIWK